MANNITYLDKEITSNVLKIKCDLGLTTSNLAEALNVDDSFIRNVESFRKKYNIKHLFILFNFFNENNNSIYKYKNGIKWKHIIPDYDSELLKNIKKGSKNDE